MCVANGARLRGGRPGDGARTPHQRGTVSLRGDAHEPLARTLSTAPPCNGSTAASRDCILFIYEPWRVQGHCLFNYYFATHLFETWCTHSLHVQPGRGCHPSSLAALLCTGLRTCILCPLLCTALTEPTSRTGLSSLAGACVSNRYLGLYVALRWCTCGISLSQLCRQALQCSHVNTWCPVA